MAKFVGHFWLLGRNSISERDNEPEIELREKHKDYMRLFARRGQEPNREGEWARALGRLPVNSYPENKTDPDLSRDAQ